MRVRAQCNNDSNKITLTESTTHKWRIMQLLVRRRFVFSQFDWKIKGKKNHWRNCVYAQITRFRLFIYLLFCRRISDWRRFITLLHRTTYNTSLLNVFYFHTRYAFVRSIVMCMQCERARASDRVHFGVFNKSVVAWVLSVSLPFLLLLLFRRRFYCFLSLLDAVSLPPLDVFFFDIVRVWVW